MKKMFSRKPRVDNNTDRITVGLYRVQNGESFMPLTSEDIENIRTIASEFTAAAKKASRPEPEIVLSILLVPDWQHGSSYEHDTYKKAQKSLLKEISTIMVESDINFRIEDFYNKASLNAAEKAYLNGLEALGSNADMIKMHAIICPENRNRRHLQLDANTKIFNYEAFYNNTFNTAKQTDALNASFYDAHYVSAHNKIVYTIPGGKVAPALQEVHLKYCNDHKDDHNHKSIESEKKIIDGDSKNSIYSKDFTVALNKIGLTTRKVINNSGKDKIIYPAVLDKPEYRITKHVLTAVNMTWKPVSELEKIIKEYNDKLNQLPGVKIGQAIGDFAGFKNAVKKYTASLHDHVINDSDGKMEKQAHDQLLSISNQGLEKKVIKDFIENTFKNRPDMITGVLDIFSKSQRSKDFVRDLYNETETLESLNERAHAIQESKGKSLSTDEQLEEMAVVKRSEMAASAFGQGSNTAKEIAFKRNKPAFPQGFIGFKARQKSIEANRQNNNSLKNSYTR